VSISDALTLIAGVAASFGIGAGVVLVLSKYLGELWAKRALQNEGAKLQEKLEELKHELSLTRSSYENHVSLILEYFATFYRHYRMCQRAASADAYQQPDGAISHTKEEYLNNLEGFLSEWAENEGKIRLLLPEQALQLHEESVECFNKFTRAVKDFRKTEETRAAKIEAFVEIERVKKEMERMLRQFLRTEKLFK
jgi:hypothetical protein